ncbi:pol-like protein ENS-3 [Grus japonensis]|uniref:ribonuclease H n=1 Tax=Grus japonensis TaxID=30415 RepID=A0ABC9YFP8_GRUJA
MVIQAAAHAWMVTLDVKDIFFMMLLREEDKPQFAFTWEGVQYTFNRLPQGYKHSPTIAHNALAKLLDTVEVSSDIRIYQYIDDILVGGDNKEQVGQVAKVIWNLLRMG